MTINTRRPAEPPPIQIALAKTGSNKRCMIFFRFFAAIHSPIISCVKLPIASPPAYGVLHPCPPVPFNSKSQNQ